MPRLQVTAAVLLGAAILGELPAIAAEPESAQALYDRGLAAMKAGRFEEACPALEQSYKLEPLAGALFTLAECEAKRGRSAVAAGRYDEYLRVYATLSPDKQAKQGEREKLARAARAALAQKVAELTLALPPSAPPETKVQRDGQPVPPAALGVPVLVDPGEHVIRIQVPGVPERVIKVTLAAGERKGVALETGKTEVAFVPVGGGTDPARAEGPNKSVIIAGAAVAGASAIAGAIFAGLWSSKGSDARTQADKVRASNIPCTVGGVGTQPSQACTNLVSDLGAQATFGSAAVGTFVAAGAVGLATLTYGLVAGRNARTSLTVSPVVTAQGGGLFVGGSF